MTAKKRKRKESLVTRFRATFSRGGASVKIPKGKRKDGDV